MISFNCAFWPFCSWILYEKPGFEGRCIALEEEGVTELPNQWAEEGEETSAPVVIGSIRLAVRVSDLLERIVLNAVTASRRSKEMGVTAVFSCMCLQDYTPPRIELFTEPAGRGRSSEFVGDTEEVGSFSHPQSTGSIKVHSGL